MKTLTKTVSALALTFALAACGGPAEEEFATPEATASDTAAAATPTDGATPTEGATPTDAAATPSADASATPTAAASATPAAAAAKPAATVAAAAPAGPPQAFTQCSVCHKVEAGKNGIGPSLAGVFGAKSGHLGDSFKYSPAMLGAGLTWNQATLDRYLKDPKSVVPGTIMSFGGVKDDAKRAEIIAYLRSL